MAMKKVVVLGAGAVGKSVAELLLGAGKGNYEVTIADRDPANLAKVEQAIRSRQGALKLKGMPLSAQAVDAGDQQAVRALLKGKDYVVCMLPFRFVGGVAEAAASTGTNYFDVTEDVATTRKVRAIAAKKPKCALVPQCGLAPGYIAIAAHDLVREMAQVHSLTLRVGALPQFPTNALRYNLTWSTDGLINEYCEPCNVMLQGETTKVPALEGHETFLLEGTAYEAFYTSGGVGSLLEAVSDAGKVTKETCIAYKTIRYPGHRDLMRFLLDDLRFRERPLAPAKPAKKGEKKGSPAPAEAPGGVRFDRDLLIKLFDHAVPRTEQDVVVIFINAIGIDAKGRRVQASVRKAIPATKLWGRVWPAIESTTAAGVCAMVDLHRSGALPARGFVAQEACTLEMFNSTPFGAVYEDIRSLVK